METRGDSKTTERDEIETAGKNYTAHQIREEYRMWRCSIQSAVRDSDADAEQPGTSRDSAGSPPRHQPTWRRKQPCPHCGGSVLKSPSHFPYKGHVYCEDTAEEGQTLEDWLKYREVPRTTIWRLKKKQLAIQTGTLPARKEPICRQCGERVTRAAGHGSAARGRFCEKTDPLGRTVKQWLTEKRGGVTTEKAREAAREVRRSRRISKLRPPPKKAHSGPGSFCQGDLYQHPEEEEEECDEAFSG